MNGRLEKLTSKAKGGLTDRLAGLTDDLDAHGVLQAVDDPAKLAEAADAALRQSQTALDDLQQRRTDKMHASQATAQQSLEDVFEALKNHDWAAKVGLLTILALLLWKAIVPTTAEASPGTAGGRCYRDHCSSVLKLPVLYVEVPDNLWSEIHFPSLAVLQSAPWKAILQGGIVLAVVASAETLLCATAVDQMQSDTRTNYNRELTAQGIGNMVCGLFGALPMTGVIVRSSANVDAGAQDPSLNDPARCVVAGLCFAASLYPSHDPDGRFGGHARLHRLQVGQHPVDQDLRKYGWGEVAIYFITVGTIVGTDLLTGVLTGIGLSAVKLLYTFSHLVVQFGC